MRGLTKQFANPPRKTGAPFYGDPDTIRHYLLNGDILMKNKKEPRLPDAQCTCPYISGRERGSDAVIRKIAPFRVILLRC